MKVQPRMLMKSAILFILGAVLFSLPIYGQSLIQTKEVKTLYSNGRDVFTVCVSGCQTVFKDDKEYHWYTEFSKIKSTKGGSGGNLLHGNYKFYDEEGNLRVDKGYYMGLLDGSSKSWDSLGNIVSQSKYVRGENVYLKFKNEKGFWIEFNGPMFKEGTVRKVYNTHNVLISEEVGLTDLRQHVKLYYERSGKLEREFSSSMFDREECYGRYITYYENGKVEVEGQFNDVKYTSIRVGTWKWYNEDGSFDASETYKAEIEKWSNGEMKSAGGYILDSKTNTWLRNGEWKWYSEEGQRLLTKTYRFGEEINE